MLGSALPETLTKARVPKARIKLSDKQVDPETRTTSFAPRGKLKLSEIRKAKNG
jgi:hypothetical protein